MDLTSFVAVAKPMGLLGIRVTRHDEEIATWHLEPECRRNVYSASKSVTALAVGFAVQEGLLSIKEKLTDAFPDDLPETVDDNLAAATVRDLLTMRLGQAESLLMGEQRPEMAEDDWVKYSLSVPFVYAPGERFLYSNVGPYLAGVLVQRRAGCDLVSYLTPRLFKSLGIRRPTWEIDPMGYTFGAGGLFLTLRELHTIGRFCLKRGAWNGRQLLDPNWIDACAKQPNDDRYGYLFWRGKYDSFRADGKYAQLSIILPKRDAVVSIVAESRTQDALLDAVMEEVCGRL